MSAGKARATDVFNQVDVDRAAEYSAADADVTLRLHLRCGAMRLPTLKAVYRNHRADRSCRCCTAWNARACSWIVNCCGSRARSWPVRMLELQALAHAEAGGPFNLESPKQLQENLVRQARHSGDAQDAHRPDVDGGRRAREHAANLSPA